jgi:hypothetical protein
MLDRVRNATPKLLSPRLSSFIFSSSRLFRCLLSASSSLFSIALSFFLRIYSFGVLPLSHCIISLA